jgi:hypothetical protein
MAKNVTDFNIMNFKVTNNNASAVSFTQFTIEMDRFLGVNTKVSDIKIWEGTDRKSPGTAMWTGSTYSSVINLTRPLTIEPGATVEYKVTADIGNGGTPADLGEQYKFTITDMNFGGSPVEGVPLMGNAIRVSTVASNNTVAITDESIVDSSTNFAIGGRGIEVGKFKLSAPNDEKVTVKSIKIANNGAGISTGEIESVELYNGETLLGSAEVDRDIVFETPVEIPASGNVILTVKINSTIDIDDTDTFRAQIADAKDIDAVGDLFGSSLDLDITVPLNFTNTYTASEATVTVSGIQTAQSTTALQSAKNFKLGTVYVKNNNVEDIRLSTLKVNIKPTNAANAPTTLASLDSIKNLRLVAPDGTTVLDSVTNLDSQPTAGTSVENLSIDYVVTFSLANEYTINKNTEVGFTVLADVPTVVADAGFKVQLSFYNPSTTTNASHLIAVGQSSGTQLYAGNAATAVVANTVEILASTAQDLVITEDAEWDNANGTPLAVGNDRIVGNWKIADLDLNEDAEVTELVVTNIPAVAPNVLIPETYHFSDFELYHDGVKVATAATMAANGSVTFGDGETTMFTVTDGDTSGKTLVVKADISSDVDANDQLDLQIGATDVTARGVSTGQPIDATGTAIDLTNNKVLKTRYATIALDETTATSVASGTSNELLRFTVTPQSGETINIGDLTLDIYDSLGTGNNEALTIYDVTNQRVVTLAGAPVLANAAATTITFADAYSKYTSFSNDPITFAVRANTFAVLGAGNNGSYQLSIDYKGDTLQVDAPTQDGLTGFAPLGDKVTGKTINVSG